MRAELVLLGRRVDMARQMRRRALVVGIYTVLTVLIVGMWFVDHWRATGAYGFWAAMVACQLFLGGNFAGGLIKPFTGKGPKQSDAPPPLLLLKLRVYQTVTDDEGRAFRNDEREVTQRDRAHYRAYQAMGIAVLVGWWTAYTGMLKPAWLSWIPMTPYQILYGLMLVTLMLFLTLPQCILLWTEPDMEGG